MEDQPPQKRAKVDFVQQQVTKLADLPCDKRKDILASFYVLLNEASRLWDDMAFRISALDAQSPSFWDDLMNIVESTTTEVYRCASPIVEKLVRISPPQAYGESLFMSVVNTYSAFAARRVDMSVRMLPDELISMKPDTPALPRIAKHLLSSMCRSEAYNCKQTIIFMETDKKAFCE